jgi:pimeloyl-ACP methyl ester carboxylesterase
VALDQPAAGLNAATLRYRAATLPQLDLDVLTSLIDDRIWGSYDRDAFLARIGCPALLLQADPDAGGVITDALADHAASLLADGTLVRWPGAGHNIHGQLPLAFVQVVTDFLESTRV